MRRCVFILALFFAASVALADNVPFPIIKRPGTTTSGSLGVCSISVDNSFSGAGTDVDPLSVLGGVDVTNAPTGAGQCLNSTSASAATWGACASGGGGGGIGGNTPNSPGSDNVYNVINYGAVGDNSHDDTTAIQTAYNAACNAISSRNPGNTSAVFFPQTTVCYKTTKPIVMMCSTGSPRLFGINGGWAGQTNTGATICPAFNGPAVVGYSGLAIAQPVMGGAYSGVTLTPSLVTGAGNSMTWSATAGAYLNLSDTLGMRRIADVNGRYQAAFNGLAQFGIRGFVSWAGDGNGTHTYPIWVSNGALDLGTTGCGGTPFIGACKDFGYLWIDGAGKLWGALMINGTERKLDSGGTVLTPNVTYEVELNYDGANVNLYLGTVAGGTITRVAQIGSLSGNTTQRPDENNWLGGSSDISWAYQHQSFFDGSLDSIEISKVARHTAASFTADTAKFTADSNTMWLDNFDLNQFNAVTIQGHATNSPIYQVDKAVVPNGAPNATAWGVIHSYLYGCCGGDYRIDHLEILPQLEGILSEGAALDVEDVTAFGGYMGVHISADSGYTSVVKDSYFESDNLTPILGMGGIIQISRINAGAALYELVLGSNAEIDNYFMSPNGGTVCGIAISTAGTLASAIRLNAASFDNENGGTFPAFCVQGYTTDVLSITNSFIQSNLAPLITMYSTYAGGIRVSDSVMITPSGQPLLDDSEVAALKSQTGALFLENNAYTTGATVHAIPATQAITSNGNMPYTVGPSPVKVAGTTAGFYVWDLPVFTTEKKEVIVLLNGYRNSGGTAQTVALPAGGLTAVSAVTALNGNCTGVAISTSTITLPSSMGSPQSGQCQAVGY